MKRKFQVRFLGGSGAERLPSYPVQEDQKSKIREQYCITEEDVINFRERSVGLNGIPLAHVSWFLSAQLACAKKFRTLNTFAVTDVIQRLATVHSHGLEEKPSCMQEREG